jgi:8-oxo-dGTP pyrophosphatase MutT (NUDIX family)
LHDKPSRSRVKNKIKPGQKVRAAGILLMSVGQQPPQFLLMRHSDRWDLPKGHCEQGESFRDAALRETEEETGISPQTISLDPGFSFELSYPVTYRSGGNHTLEKQVRYFLGYVRQKPKLTLTEHESAKWFDWNPPHRIQLQTIDPLLAAVSEYLKNKEFG